MAAIVLSSMTGMDSDVCMFTGVMGAGADWFNLSLISVIKPTRPTLTTDGIHGCPFSDWTIILFTLSFLYLLAFITCCNYDWNTVDLFRNLGRWVFTPFAMSVSLFLIVIGILL